MIIFINGASSSGKSTIAKSLQHLGEKPLLAVGINTFLDMMPAQSLYAGAKATEGFQFTMDRDEEEPITRVTSGPYGDKICAAMLKVIKTMADDELDLIMDEVLFEDDKLRDYVKVLKEHTVYFMGIHCSLDALSEGEILRGNRALGLGREQVYRVHGSTRFYDLELDTTKKSAFDCAIVLMKFLPLLTKP